MLKIRLENKQSTKIYTVAAFQKISTTFLDVINKRMYNVNMSYLCLIISKELYPNFKKNIK